ncbi:MAG: hypothetical protein IT463_09775 [Planctomycetes bacterium]|nr:hypothetical protein [Planctomycetota bacterium]
MAKEPPEAALRQRLAFLADRFGQAAIARKTGTTRSNVHRYLRGTQVPAWFCTALCDAFAVSPAWLLQGTGNPLRTALQPGTADAADTLLELNQAMDAVARLQLGALGGDLDARRVRELQDAAAASGRLRKRVSDAAGRALSGLAGQVADAIRSGAITRARGLVKTGELVATLAPDSDEYLDFRYLAAAVENLSGNAVRARNEVRRVLVALVAAGRNIDRAVLVRVSALASTAYNLGDMATARTIAVLVADLCGEDPLQSPFAAKIQVLLSDIDATEGRMAQSMQTLSRYYPCASREFAEQCGASMVLNSYFCGIADFDGVSRIAEMGAGKASALMRIAVWEEEPAHLAAVLEGPRRFEGWPEQGAHRTLQRMQAAASALQAALAGKYRAAALRRVLGELPGSPLQSLRDDILCLQVEQRAGAAVAARRVGGLWEQVAALKPLVLGHLWEATLHRVALRAPRQKAWNALRARALEFFARAVSNGSARFAALAAGQP